ncbi:peptidylprolyl isomerase [Neisseria leonii]|uniref:Peptidylprolyl isomerase n=1 Tax=Neisseria leonii TaxID=2995413 RepID=A0A9X4E122_9NEIS|nr:peptidylprolyl isomerase [Neisseria sp. 51.81]MDD9327530.1 peptidylprolyl isomerase [Neisseria sp. 51.81]
MKMKTVLLAVMAGLALPTVQAAGVKAVDSIAAVADNQVITLSRLNAAVEAAKRSGGVRSMTDGQIRNQVLAQLINESLLVQAGKRRGLAASEAEVDAELARQAAAQKVGVEALYARAARSGIGRNALRRQAADAVVGQKVRQQVIQQQAQVSDQEIDAAIEQAARQGIALPEGGAVKEYRAQHILIKADQALAAAAAEDTIHKLWREARSGQDFAQLARQYSQDAGSAPQGGDLGWFSDGVMVPEFEAAVKSLEPGQLSRPVKSQFGWHIIRLNETRESGSPEARRRHAVRNLIVQQKAAQAQAALLQQLYEGAYVDVRVR